MVTAHEKKMMTIQKAWESLKREAKGAPDLVRFVQSRTHVNMATAKQYATILENLGSVYKKTVDLSRAEAKERGFKPWGEKNPPATEVRWFALVSSPPVQVKDGVGGFALQSEVAGLDVEKKE